jgi:hypothetical protein
MPPSPSRLAAIGLILGLLALDSGASGIEMESFVLDLTKTAETRGRLLWSPREGLGLHADGLGWDGDPAASRDGWIQLVEPIAVGFPGWAPSSVSVQVRVIRESARTRDGEPVLSHELVFARYGPDGVHWSSWQRLDRKDGAHGGTLTVPRPEREAWERLRSRRLRIVRAAGRLDDEVLVRRALEEDPRFLERAIPFIGYVQLLHQASYRGGERIRRLEGRLTWCVPGPVRWPEKRGSRWRFRATLGLEGEGRLVVPTGAAIRALDLGGSAVTNAGLTDVRHAIGLRRLDLSLTEIGDEGLAHLADLRLLEFLDLSDTRITDHGIRDHLGRLAALREIRLRSTAVTEIGLNVLVELPELRRIDIRDTVVRPEALVELEAQLVPRGGTILR